MNMERSMFTLTLTIRIGLSAWGKMFAIMHWELWEMPSGHWRRLWELRGINLTSFSRIKIKARCTQESNGVFNLIPLALSATRRCDFDFHLLPLDILMTLECMIENIFPHLTTWQSKGVYYQAWNIKLSAKTWNRLKFPTRVISMVYCSMGFPMKMESRNKGSPATENFCSCFVAS